jgi:hypothetical protein
MVSSRADTPVPDEGHIPIAEWHDDLREQHQSSLRYESHEARLPRPRRPVRLADRANASPTWSAMACEFTRLILPEE